MQIISWNVDGLDKELLPPRHLNLVSTISKFDVVFMQEVVGETWDIVKTQLVDYEHYIGKTIDEYFVSISVDKTKLDVEKAEYNPFDCSFMAMEWTLYWNRLEILAFVVRKAKNFILYFY